MSGIVSWFGTWAVMILLLVFLGKTQWGRPVVYGLVWLAILILLVSHADELASFFNPAALQLNG